MNWQVYIILCSDNTLYTGITTDLQRRFGQHASGRGAKYFRGRQPVQVVYLESGHTRNSAATREVAIKNLARAAKLRLISSEITGDSCQQKDTIPSFLRQPLL
ncbi:MAG: GIY-YIG nuclease family protein [Desulfuromonadaceae bacterium]|nr:GIY-YIG nuclease family protein [Desulfuromonadaceae bacterium]